MNIQDLDLTILKGIVSSKKSAVEFNNSCDTKVFSLEARHFASLIVSYFKLYKELPTQRVIEEQLTKGNNKTQIDYCNQVWSKLAQVSSNENEFVFDLNKIKQRYAERQITEFKEKLDSEKMDVDRQLQEMAKVAQNIKSVKVKKSYERKTIKDAMPDFIEEYRAKIENPNFDAGIKTGYSALDNATGGLRAGEMLLIGAESGGGKSLLMMNMALQIWMNGNSIDQRDNFAPGHNIMYFSLEMPYKPCRNRLLSRLSLAPSKLIRDAKLGKEDNKKLSNAVKFIKAYPNEFEIIDIPRGVTMEMVESMYEEAKVHFQPDVVVIDYLGLMEHDGKDMDDWLKLGKISEQIHEFARVHNVIVLSAVQLNRAKGKDVEERIGLHRIGRSALIMQNANIAIQIETRPNEKQYPDMNYHIIKNRDGSQESGKLLKNLACGSLIDLPSNDEVDYGFTDVNDISEEIECLEI